MIVLTVSLTEHLDKFCSFLDAWKVAAMHEDGDKLDFIVAHNDKRHDTTHGAWKERRLVFDRNGASIPGLGELQRDTPYARCLEEQKYVACLCTLVVSPKGVTDLSNRFHASTVLDWPYDVLPFLVSSSRCGRDCNFECRMRTTYCPTLACWHLSRCWQIPRLGVVRFTSPFPSGGSGMSSVAS